MLGGGAWGTALALTCARVGRDVTLWEHDPANADSLDKQAREPLPARREARRKNRRDARSGRGGRRRRDPLVVPAQVVRSVLTALAPSLKDRTPLIACAKGIEHGTRKFMSDVIAECAPKAVPAILSGPSFAADVARGLPTAVTLAAIDADSAAALAQAIGSATFRPYHSTDLRGVEIGGATKNVLAIAAGIVAGRGLGASAAAALITRGFAELMRFGKAYGARPETMMGLSGLGDLILTCSTPQSRNFSFGVALGQGETPDAGAHGKLAEGVFTAPVLLEMARDKNVDMPIATAIAAVLAKTA